MELTQLRYFLKTAETLNYTRAAEELFTSRQALRHTLTTLEAELGKPLFRNDRNRLSLTEYGEYLKLSYGDLINTFDKRELQVKDFFREPSVLKVAFSMSLFPFHLPNLGEYLEEFQQTHPHLYLEQLRFTPDEIIDSVTAEQVDFGCVLQMPTPRPNCTRSVLRASPMTVGSGEKSPLFGKDRLTLRDITKVPLVGMGSLEKIARPLWEDCKQAGITLNYTVIPNTIDALYQIQNSIASGFNTTFNSHSNLKQSSPPRTRARLEDYTWELVALCPKNRPNHPAARLLAEFLAEKYREN